ncbi:MAG: hypothetical protein WCG27_10425 [Pseudomonadota bacterium]
MFKLLLFSLVTLFLGLPCAFATGFGEYFDMRFPADGKEELVSTERESSAQRLMRLQAYTLLGPNGYFLFDQFLVKTESTEGGGEAKVFFLTGLEEQTALNVAEIFIMHVREGQLQSQKITRLTNLSFDMASPNYKALQTFFNANRKGIRVVSVSNVLKGDAVSLMNLQHMIELKACAGPKGNSIQLPQEGATIFLLAAEESAQFSGNSILRPWFSGETQVALKTLTISDVSQMASYLIIKLFNQSGLYVTLTPRLEQFLNRLIIEKVAPDKMANRRITSLGNFWGIFLGQVKSMVGAIGDAYVPKHDSDRFQLDIFRNEPTDQLQLGLFQIGDAHIHWATPASHFMGGEDCLFLFLNAPVIK